MVFGRDERGTVTAFVTIVTTGLLMAAGLVLDGGTVLAARREAADVAQAAARAGAQALDVAAVRAARRARPEPGRAAAAARAYLRSAERHGAVRVVGGRVRVTVRVTRRLQLLQLVGLRTVTVSETGEARLVRGVTEGET